MRRPFLGLTASILLVGALLAMPAPFPQAAPGAASSAFRWDADLLFAELENEFERASSGALDEATAAVELMEAEGGAILAALSATAEPPLEGLGQLANLQFRLAVRGAAHPPLLPRVRDFIVRARVDVTAAAGSWPMDRPTHEALYRVVYGGRIALDEALVQAGGDALPALLHFQQVLSEAPSVVVEGVRVHSGDVLLSRGGAPTSALIARGNDFPSTFSHAALAYVDPDTGEGTVVESLIETGSVVSTVEEYLESKKHRILVLRLDPDHPASRDDPRLAHRAAEAILARVRAEHLPYDFAMDWSDPEAAFCSEIVFHPYREQGVELWPLRSPMSAPGLVRWLTAMGVREFTSLVPSDAELDPQLRAVAEWRDPAALMDFRLDNAVTDVLLEEAERGAYLGYSWYRLPLARLLKAYSVAQSLVGRPPTIPRGMDASTALRVDALVSTVHPTLKAALEERAGRFRGERGYEAPYWVLVELAREALAAEREGLEPALTRG